MTMTRLGCVCVVGGGLQHPPPLPPWPSPSDEGHQRALAQLGGVLCPPALRVTAALGTPWEVPEPSLS